MSEIVQFRKNRLQTVVTTGTPGTPAVGYQFRMGYVADSDTQFQSATSSFVMSQTVGANSYGVQFDNYKSANNTAEVNYMTTMGTKNKLNLFTISSVINGLKPVAITNTDYVNTDSISSGSVYARDMYTSNFTASNINADTITARLITVQYVSSIQMSTNVVVANSVSTGALTFATGYGTGTLNQNTAIVQNMTGISNNLSNVYGSTMTFTNTANLNDLNVATVNTSNYINAPLANINTISSGTLSYNFAYGKNLSSQNVSTNTLGFVSAIGTTLQLAGSLTVPNVNAVTVSTGTTTYNLAIGNSISTQSLSTSTMGFVSAIGTTVQLLGSLTVPTMNAVTASTGTTTYNLAIGNSISTQSLSTSTMGFVSAIGTNVQLSGSLTVPTMNAVTASTGTTTYNLAIGNSISTQSLSTSTMGFITGIGNLLTLSTASINNANVAQLNVSGNTILSTATAKAVTTDILNANYGSISAATMSTLGINCITAEGVSTMTLSSGTIYAGTVLANIFTTSTVNAYNMNLGSSINFLNGDYITALSGYNGMRVTDPDSGNELGFFLLTDASGVNAKIAAVDSTGSNQTTLLEYFSTATGTRIINYVSEISSLTAKLSYGTGTLVGQALSTTLISTGQVFVNTVNASVVNTLTLSTNNAIISTLASGIIAAQDGISTNNLSSGNSYLGRVAINNAYANSISTIYLSSGQSYFGVSVTNNASITNLSTTNGTITNFAATTGTVTNGTINNLSTINGTITNFAAATGTVTNGTITNLSTTNGTITNFAATTGTVTNGTITNLSTVNGTITNFVGTNGTITNLSTTNGTITNFAATNGTVTNGTITNLSTTNGTIANFAATNGTVTNGTITNLSTVNGTINNFAATLGVVTNGTITNLSTTNGTITNFAATTGAIVNLTTTNGTITNLSTTNGTVTNLAGTNGAINNLSTVNGTITNFAATTGVITNGTITNLSTTNGTITTFAAVNAIINSSITTSARISNGIITHMSTTNGSVVNFAASNAFIDSYAGNNITLTSNFVGPFISTIQLNSGNAKITTALVDDLTASNITTTSDMRLKKNVLPLSNALNTVLQLNPVSYDWNSRVNMRDGYQEIGFIAQAVESVLPNIVSVRNDEINTLSIGYDRLTAVLTGAVKELAARVSALEAQLAK